MNFSLEPPAGRDPISYFQDEIIRLVRYFEGRLQAQRKETTNKFSAFEFSAAGESDVIPVSPTTHRQVKLSAGVGPYTVKLYLLTRFNQHRPDQGSIINLSFPAVTSTNPTVEVYNKGDVSPITTITFVGDGSTILKSFVFTGEEWTLFQ